MNSSSKIIVRSQIQLDSISANYDGQILIYFGESHDRAKIKKRYIQDVIVNKNYYVEIYGNACIQAYGKSDVNAYGRSIVKAYGNSSIKAFESSSVIAYENSFIECSGKTSIVAYAKSSIIACGRSSVEAYGYSLIEARERSSVKAYENSSVRAYENSSIIANGNVQIIDFEQNAVIKTSGFARVVYHPKTIEEFMDFNNIQYKEGMAIFYKAVHKKKGFLISNYDSNDKYIIGETIEAKHEENLEKDYEYGIKIASLDWALSFGEQWNDLSIIEVETNIEDIIFLEGFEIRTKKCKILREVPLEECGILGSILSKK